MSTPEKPPQINDSGLGFFTSLILALCTAIGFLAAVVGTVVTVNNGDPLAIGIGLLGLLLFVMGVGVFRVADDLCRIGQGVSELHKMMRELHSK